MNSTACRGRHCRQLGRLCYRYGRLCRQCVRGQSEATPSTLSTFNKVDRIEFNFVACSVYRALDKQCTLHGSVCVQFYFHRRLDSDYSVLCKYIVEMLVCMAAVFTCLSRVTDNMHHSSDVLGGAAIGVIVAVWNVRTNETRSSAVADRARDAPCR